MPKLLADDGLFWLMVVGLPMFLFVGVGGRKAFELAFFKDPGLDKIPDRMFLILRCIGMFCSVIAIIALLQYLYLKYAT